MKINTIGIDLGKTSFHLAGLNERAAFLANTTFALHLESESPCDWNGSLRRLPFSGTGAPRAGTRGASDPCPVREAVRETNKRDYIDREAIAEAVEAPEG
jgi:transposase